MVNISIIGSGLYLNTQPWSLPAKMREDSLNGVGFTQWGRIHSMGSESLDGVGVTRWGRIHSMGSESLDGVGFKCWKHAEPDPISLTRDSDSIKNRIWFQL